MVEINRLGGILHSRKTLIVIACLLIVAVVIIVYLVITREAPVNDFLSREISRLEEAVSQNPNDLDSRVELAALYSEAGYHNDAINQLETTLEIEDEYVDALILLGYIYIDAGEYEQALSPYAKIIELNQDNPMKHINRQLESAYYYTGLAFINLDMFSDAIQSFQQALNIDRTDADAWFMLGESYRYYSDYSQAIECYEQAIRFVPDFGDAYYGLARCYEATGQTNLMLYAEAMEDYSSGLYEDAIDKLEKVILVDSEFAMAYLGLGLAYENTSQVNNAVDAYERALQIRPDLWLAQSKIEALTVRDNEGTD